MRRRHAYVAATAGLAVVAVAPAAAAAPTTDATAAPSFRVTPERVQRGDSLHAIGRRWPARTRVRLLIGPPNSEASPVAWARTTRRGRFRKRVRIAPGARTGPFVMLACRRQCAVKRSARFTITR